MPASRESRAARASDPPPRGPLAVDFSIQAENAAAPGAVRRAVPMVSRFWDARQKPAFIRAMIVSIVFTRARCLSFASMIVHGAIDVLVRSIMSPAARR